MRDGRGCPDWRMVPTDPRKGPPRALIEQWALWYTLVITDGLDGGSRSIGAVVLGRTS